MSFLGGNKQTLSTPDIELPGGAGTLVGRTGSVQGNGLFNGPQGFLGGLGRIGDALALAGGQRPVYAPQQQEEAARNAFGQLISEPQNQQAFAQLAQANPGLAMQFMNAMKKAEPDQTNTEKVHDYILRTYGPQAADEYIRNNVTAGPVQPVIDPNNPNNVVYKTRADLLGGPSAEPQMPSWWNNLTEQERGVIQKQAESRAAKTNVPTGSPLSNAPRVTNDDDYNALPVGTRFYDPQGNLRTKSKK